MRVAVVQDSLHVPLVVFGRWLKMIGHHESDQLRSFLSRQKLVKEISLYFIEGKGLLWQEVRVKAFFNFF